MRARRAAAALLTGALLAISSSIAAADDAHNDYMIQCQGCHLADGSGSFGAGTGEIGAVPDLRDRIGLYLTVPGGREYLVQVPGSAQSSLSNGELAAVLNWMIRTYGPAEVARDFVLYTAPEIVRSRTPLADVARVRHELLGRIEATQRDAIGGPSAPLAEHAADGR